ncbi:MAG: hypothetical protein IH614_00695 [Desulfuromonadales bacterium]|nr:hypothetical protein [Desulfuromonadales bacterium]
MRTAQTTFYAKGTGLEIAPYERRGGDRPSEGRVSLRFFRLESGTAAIRFLAEPAESFELYCRIAKVFRDGGKELLTHRFEGSEGEVQTRLSIERYESGGRTGYAFSVQRGEERINVPVSGERFLYAGEFLKHLSLAQAWVEQPAA